MADPDPELVARIQRARADGDWFWVEWIGNWRTADQFDADFREGLTKGLIWGVASPATVIEVLRAQVERGRADLQHAEAELARAIRAKREIDGAQ